MPGGLRVALMQINHRKGGGLALDGAGLFLSISGGSASAALMRVKAARSPW
jgi:hypothetical protein